MSETENDETDDTTEAQTEDEPVDEGLVDTSDEDINLDEVADQEWTLGGAPERTQFQFKGMKFVVEDPDDDAVLNMMAQAEMGDSDTSQRMYELVSSAVVEPEVTAERWRDLRMSERIGLMVRVSEAIGLDDMMDFPESGPEAPQV
jgi:hypothetical protein